MDHISIPVHVFGDFPIINKRRVGTINLTCYDEDNDDLERTLRTWMEEECFSGTRVRYLSQMYKQFIYKSYNVKGELKLTRTYLVIPTGGITINRSYEDNNAKLVEFSLAVVGANGASVKTGEGKPQL